MWQSWPLRILKHQTELIWRSWFYHVPRCTYRCILPSMWLFSCVCQFAVLHSTGPVMVCEIVMEEYDCSSWWNYAVINLEWFLETEIAHYDLHKWKLKTSLTFLSHLQLCLSSLWLQILVLFNSCFLLQLEFSPQTLCCYGKQLCTIPRDATYYSYQNR